MRVERLLLLLEPYEMTVHEHGAFIQDDFKFSDRITANAGLRFERFTPGVADGNRLNTISQNVTAETNPLNWAIVPRIENPFPPVVQIKPRTTAESNAANPRVLGHSFGTARSVRRRSDGSRRRWVITGFCSSR